MLRVGSISQKKDVEDLEDLDKIYLRRVFETASSAPIPALYLELGIIPLRFKIQAKRLMFLYYLLTRDENELTSQVLQAQIDDPIKGDWILTVMDDLKSFGLSHLSMDNIKIMKKEKFKELIRKSCKSTAFTFLMNEKQEKNKSKLAKVSYNKLEMQSYLENNNLSQRKKLLLFKFRCRMIKVGRNFGRQDKCPACLTEVDEQQHLFQCDKLNDLDLDSNSYEDLFSNNEEKYEYAINRGDSIIRKREKIINSQSE